MAVPNLYDPTTNAANATPARFDLLVDTYSPEIQGQYHYNLFVNRMVAQKMIPDGHIAMRFKKTGRIGTAKHNEGDSFYGMTRDQTYRTIHLDDRPQWAGIEEEDLINLFENDPSVRSDTVIEIADALSSWTEVETLKLLWAGANTAAQANVDGAEFRGSYDWNAGNFSSTASRPGTHKTDVTEDIAGAQKLLAYWDEFVVALENEGIPARGFNCVMSPALWQSVYKLDQVQDDASSASTTASPTAGNASIFSDNRINSNPLSVSEYYDYTTPLKYNGLSMWKHNLWTSGARSGTGFAKDHSAVGNPQSQTGGLNRNENTAANCSAILFRGDAIGFVNKMGPVMKIETPSRTDNELIRSKVLIGGGVVNPELVTAFEKA